MEKQQKPLRVLVVGCGNMGFSHAKKTHGSILRMNRVTRNYVIANNGIS
jgi:hypothetical protein